MRKSISAVALVAAASLTVVGLAPAASAAKPAADGVTVAKAIVAKVVEQVRACEAHPAILAYALGNEIPPSVVRWHGASRVERFLRDLLDEFSVLENVRFGLTVNRVDLPEANERAMGWIERLGTAWVEGEITQWGVSAGNVDRSGARTPSRMSRARCWETPAASRAASSSNTRDFASADSSNSNVIRPPLMVARWEARSAWNQN